jgi:hypothetical protein
MTERIGDIVVIETFPVEENHDRVAVEGLVARLLRERLDRQANHDAKAVIALRGIISIVDTHEEKPAEGGFLRLEPCTAIVIEGGRQINVSREDGTFIRRCFKDYAREQAAQKALR